MIDRRLGLQIALVGALAAAGWLLGRATHEQPPVPIVSPQQRPVTVTQPALPEVAVQHAAAPVDRLHPRPTDEWQGMLVDLTQRQYCEASSYCGLALACLDDQACGPCSVDAQCASGEVCVLDHCVQSANAACRTRADCAAAGDDAMCILSGLTGGEPRGNGDMRSYCQTSAGGLAQDHDAPDPRRAAQLAEAVAQVPVDPPVSADDLRARLDAEPGPQP